MQLSRLKHVARYYTQASLLKFLIYQRLLLIKRTYVHWLIEKINLDCLLSIILLFIILKKNGFGFVFQQKSRANEKYEYHNTY